MLYPLSYEGRGRAGYVEKLVEDLVEKLPRPPRMVRVQPSGGGAGQERRRSGDGGQWPRFGRPGGGRVESLRGDRVGRRWYTTPAPAASIHQVQSEGERCRLSWYRMHRAG